MPHANVSATGSDDFGATDEVKVYKEEGDEDGYNKSFVENLSEEKFGLLSETEQVGLGHV